MPTTPPPVGKPDSRPGSAVRPTIATARPLTQRTRTIREIERSQLDALERSLPPRGR